MVTMKRLDCGCIQFAVKKENITSYYYDRSGCDSHFLTGCWDRIKMMSYLDIDNMVGLYSPLKKQVEE